MNRPIVPGSPNGGPGTDISVVVEDLGWLGAHSVSVSPGRERLSVSPDSIEMECPESD